jgi:DNA adenine methylase
MDEDEYVIENLQLQIFGSPGGKSRVSVKLVECIPEHKTYVEPFVGGGAVYFKKTPVETEVVNDKNTEIAFAYSFVKNLTDEQMNRLKTFDWEPNKEKFFKLKDSEVPKDPVQRFYRFYYVLIYSYGLSSKTYGYFEKDKFHLDKRVAKLKERMKNTKVYSGDYLEVMKQYDSPETFFFLDPPYPNEWTGPEGTKLFSKEDTQKLHDYLKTVKGKFLMTINSLKWIVDMFSDFKQYKLLVPRTFKHGDEPKFELIVTNYEVKKKEVAEQENAETGASSVAGAPSTTGGLQPTKIVKPKDEDDLDKPNLEKEELGAKFDRQVNHIKDSLRKSYPDWNEEKITSVAYATANKIKESKLSEEEIKLAIFS